MKNYLKQEQQEGSGSCHSGGDSRCARSVRVFCPGPEPGDYRGAESGCVRQPADGQRQGRK